MAFEKFFKTKRNKFSCMATLNKSGAIFFNVGCIRKFNLIENRFCYLYFDKEWNRIGVEFLDKEDEYVSVCKSYGKISARIFMKSFLDNFKIDYSKKRSFEVYDEKGMLIINLNKEI